MATALRFAILCRVSTETQEKEGVSLEVQKNTLIKCVEMFNGTVVKEYIGQEHGTEGYERPILDEMLLDASKKMFDAAMVYTLSRLTRDPAHSQFILAKLKNSEIRLFEQTREIDLSSPETMLYAGIMAQFGAYEAARKRISSVESKIELAKKGWWVVGAAPWGRVLEHNDRSKPAVWILDPTKAALAQKIYDLYANQRIYVDRIATILEMPKSTIYKILNDKARLIQTISFKRGEKKVIEVKTPVPPLFTKEQQENIKALLKANRRGTGRKHNYLLSGMVKCQGCGLIYQGVYANNDKNPYYRHSAHNRNEKCVRFIKKPELDRVVLAHIADLVSNNDLLIKTIQTCNDFSLERKRLLEKEIKSLLAKQEKIGTRKARIVKFIGDGILLEDEAAAELQKIRKAEEDVMTELLSKKTELESISNAEIPEEVLRRIKYTLDCLQQKFGKSISKWSFEIQRLLVEWFFGLSDKHGVWITGQDGEVLYTIRSSLGTIGFGIVGDECEYGVTGQGAMREATSNTATLAQFSSIIRNLDIMSILASS